VRFTVLRGALGWRRVVSTGVKLHRITGENCTLEGSFRQVVC
jgi:hypothetical protein